MRSDEVSLRRSFCPEVEKIIETGVIAGSARSRSKATRLAAPVNVNI